MKLKFTHKTWYFFLLCAAAASMLNGFAVLGGMDFSFLEMAAFCITGITLLFLAAEKGSSAKDKRNYFGLFVVLMLSYMGRGWAAYIGAGLARPAGLRIPEGQTHSAAAAAGGRGRGAPSALCSADGLRRHGGPELLGEPALGVAGLRPRLGRAEPV